LRDKEKKTACSSQGITLIEIPFWWDLHIESLAATIIKYRPDLSPRFQGIVGYGNPIPV
jgi:hypothetical protein